MIRTFDIFNLPEEPELTLCNPSGDQLYSLKGAYNKKITLRFNAVSEFDFDFPSEVNGTAMDAYDYLVSKRLVLVENFGYFLIVNPEKLADGLSSIKRVKCVSIDGELISKKLVVFGGTYKLYDILEPSNTILGKMIQYAPAWSVNYVDSTLLEKYRTFDISDSNVYGFLTTDVEQAYGCVFVFDYENKTISAYATANATTDTDIFLSFNNVVKDLTLREISDEICTALLVYGGGNLDIRTVNPLGTAYIYNFDYFKTTEWMSAGLISALNSWEALIAANQANYANTLSLLKTENRNLITLEGEWADLNSEFLTLEGIQKVRIEAGQNYSDINILMEAKRAEIHAKGGQITASEMTIESLTETLEDINDSLSFSNNFTPSQIVELSNFIYENTYQNENIIQTNTMTPDEVQEQAQALYDQAVEVLAKVSVPRYEFSLNTANFISIDDFQPFINALELGSVSTIELDDESLVEAVLLEISFTFDNPNDFSATYSNRLRLDNGIYVYADLQGKNVRTGAAVSFNSLSWADWANNYKDSVSDFITSSLNATNNAIINSDNQEILINQNGLKGRTYVPATDTYEDSQVWLTSKTLAFTTNNWQTASLGLGRILYNGSYLYGLVGEAIVGRIIAGNTLRIENSANNFVLDETGATLNNASFTINSANGKSRIYLNATDGIKIESNIGGVWSDKFYVDTSGNLVFKGNLTGASGTFSGTVSATAGNIGSLVIDANGLKTSNGVNYLRGDGSLKWGALSISGSSAVFDGTIYANKLVGQINTPQLANGAATDAIISSGINAGKLTFGSMSGNRIYGGVISGPGITINMSQTGVVTMRATYMDIGSGSGSAGGLYMGGGTALLGANYTQIGNSSGSVAIRGTLNINGSNGISASVYVGGTYTAKRLNFSGGILTSYTFVY